MRMKMMGTAVCFALLLAGSAAWAKPTHFLGGHPVSVKYGGGYCYIDAPHVHVYGPDRPQLYQHVGNDWVFTADPTPFGYDGEKHPFYGHHPVMTVGAEPVFCYLDGPHVHPFEAPASPDYRVEKGVAFYVGALPPAYVKARPQRERAVNAEYRMYVDARPVIDFAPPPEWHGEVWVAPPAVEVRGPHVAVAAPGVVVGGPTVAVAAPGVAVIGPRVAVSAPGVYVAPPSVHVAAPGVVVGAPGVVVGGGVYVEGGRHHRGGDDDDQGHHDNGRHRGWYKH
jgi:hypothetical protein